MLTELGLWMCLPYKMIRTVMHIFFSSCQILWPSINSVELEMLIGKKGMQGSKLLMLLLLLSHFSSVQLCDPIDGSLPGSAIPGIPQARTLEWVAISLSNACKWKVKVKSLSRVRLFAPPWAAAYQAPPSMGFSKQEFWSGLPLPSLKLIINTNKYNNSRNTAKEILSELEFQSERELFFTEVT